MVRSVTSVSFIPYIPVYCLFDSQDLFGHRQNLFRCRGIRYVTASTTGGGVMEPHVNFTTPKTLVTFSVAAAYLYRYCNIRVGVGVTSW